MLSLSKRGTIDELIAEVRGLPESTATVDAGFAADVKRLAVNLLNAARTPETNGAFLNLTANVVPTMHARQCDVQVTAVKL
jgi:hypothetical protein